VASEANETDDTPPSFVIRVTRRAVADIQRAWEHMAASAGEEGIGSLCNGVNSMFA
jgi:hypothetical protein